jgi:hypothetical protein
MVTIPYCKNKIFHQAVEHWEDIFEGNIKQKSALLNNEMLIIILCNLLHIIRVNLSAVIG